jgi:aryl-alcohol dehydrogenase-like predicted oxidoreductase
MPSITASAAGTFPLGERIVNRMGFGALRLTGWTDDPARDPDAAVAVLRRAVELGVNHIDTAAFYFSPRRSANELINRALRPYPDDLVIASKVGPGRGAGGEWLERATPEQLRGQVEENLRQLGRDHLDVVNLRRLPGVDSVVEHLQALVELRTAGLVRYIGLSDARAEHLDQARAVTPIVCVQNRYALDFGRVNDDLLRRCGEEGIAFVPFFAIAGERRTEGGFADNPAVRVVARARGVSPAQVRLAWSLSRGPHVLAIPGTGNPAHLEENIAAGAIELTAAELADLESSVPDTAWMAAPR